MKAQVDPNVKKCNKLLTGSGHLTAGWNIELVLTDFKLSSGDKNFCNLVI